MSQQEIFQADNSQLAAARPHIDILALVFLQSMFRYNCQLIEMIFVSVPTVSHHNMMHSQLSWSYLKSSHCVRQSFEEGLKEDWSEVSGIINIFSNLEYDWWSEIVEQCTTTLLLLLMLLWTLFLVNQPLIHWTMICSIIAPPWYSGSDLLLAPATSWFSPTVWILITDQFEWFIESN